MTGAGLGRQCPSLPWPLRDCDSIVVMAVPRRSTARGRLIPAQRKLREYAMVARALADTSHPVLAQIIPMRFCNLSCAYCNEYDKVSRARPARGDVPAHRPPGPARNGHDRHLGRRAADPSRPRRHHPPHEKHRRHRRHDHQRLSAESGADRAAESQPASTTCRSRIDNLEPDEVSKKSLKVLDKKLQMLAESCRVPREHQLGGRRRLQESQRRAGDRQARAGAGL